MCSTPYGITAEVTLLPPSARSQRPRAQRLTASRRRSRVELGEGVAEAVLCSTPYGITAEVTFRLGTRRGSGSSAQRLTASRRRSPEDSPTSIPPFTVLNALRHHGGGHPPSDRASRCLSCVLNALRHHGGGHLEARRRWNHRRQVLNALRHHGGGHARDATRDGAPVECSTPYGITAEVTLSPGTLPPLP